MTATAHAQPDPEARRVSPDQLRSVAPALERYTQDRLHGDVWKRPDLNPPDRSLVTVAALIASICSTSTASTRTCRWRTWRAMLRPSGL